MSPLWTLAAEVGLSRRFVSATTRLMIERVVEEAERLVAQPQHENETARAILRGIRTRVVTDR